MRVNRALTGRTTGHANWKFRSKEIETFQARFTLISRLFSMVNALCFAISANSAVSFFSASPFATPRFGHVKLHTPSTTAA